MTREEKMQDVIDAVYTMDLSVDICGPSKTDQQMHLTMLIVQMKTALAPFITLERTIQ